MSPLEKNVKKNQIFHNFENEIFNFSSRTILLIIIGILKKLSNFWNSLVLRFMLPESDCHPHNAISSTPIGRPVGWPVLGMTHTDDS